jgi:ribosomal protein S6
MQTIAKKTAVAKTDKEDMMKVYEIGYLLVSSIPQEKVADIVTSLKGAITKKGGSIIAEGEPEFTALAYTMLKKVGPINHRFDEAYFGWVKFELSTSAIEAIKKTFEENENTLRTLIITTIKDATYLGKKAAAIVRSEDVAPVVTAEAVAEAVVAAPTEEIDKSIDEMVK